MTDTPHASAADAERENRPGLLTWTIGKRIEARRCFDEMPTRQLDRLWIGGNQNHPDRKKECDHHGKVEIYGDDCDKIAAEIVASFSEPVATLTARAERAEAELARLRGVLERISDPDGHGHCRTCGTPCKGYTDCDCSFPYFEFDDPASLARAALSSEPQAAADGEIAATQLTRGNGDE